MFEFTGDQNYLGKRQTKKSERFREMRQMDSVLHIFNGDCAYDAWRGAGGKGEALVWRENYLEGDCSGGVSLDAGAFLRRRAAFLARMSGVPPEPVILRALFRQEEELIRAADRGRRLLLYLYMILMILPFQVTMVSSYGVLSFFHVLDTHWAVILPGVFSALPVFLMTKFFQGIPDSLLEAAKVDGAGEAGTFFYVGFPLGLPGIISSLILNFLEYWNAIEPPMTFLKTKSKFPVSLYLSSITLNDVGTSFAASVLIMAPSLFLFAWGQSYLEQGIIASGLKE